MRGVWPLVLLLFVQTGYALETDQYLTWGVELKDSSEAVNEWVNARMDKRLKDREVQKQKSCFDASVALMKTFRRPFFQIIEGWAQSSPEIEVWPPRTEKRQYKRTSIFSKNIFPYIMPMAFSMNVSGIYFGTDKLGHFTSFGLRYAHVYKKWRRKGLSEQAALKKAVDFGLMSEVKLVGKYVTGVISFGDLEANFQGLKMVLSLCRPHSRFHLIPREQGGWALDGQFDIRQWVNPHWDESYNESGFRRARWSGKKGLKNTLQKYCRMRNEISVAARFEYYRESYNKSFSTKYIERLEREGVLTHRHKYNFQAACSTRP